MARSTNLKTLGTDARDCSARSCDGSIPGTRVPPRPTKFCDWYVNRLNRRTCFAIWSHKKRTRSNEVKLATLALFGAIDVTVPVLLLAAHAPTLDHQTNKRNRVSKVGEFLCDNGRYYYDDRH